MKKKLKRSFLMLFLAIMMITILPTSASAASTTPGKVTLTKVSSSAYNKITINWKKTSNATNYVIYYKKSGASKWTRLATVKSTQTSYTHTSSKKYPITVGQNYTYTVRAYNSKSKKYGSYNTKGLTTKTIPSTVKLGKATLNSSKTDVTISWNKTSGCNYYVIYRKTASSSKWTKLATVKSNVTKYVDKNPVKGVKNTYTVRSFYSKTKVYGKYNSTGISVTMPAIKISKVALNKTSATLKSKGQTVQLTATVSPSNATNKALEWKSSNTKVATVSSSGKVTAVANGTATITATAKDDSKKSASCKVTVSIPSTTVPVSSVSLNQSSVTITRKWQNTQLTATVAPSNATNKALEWKSSNTNVATVDSSGKVTAVANGTTTVTATAKDGSGKSASCKVTVDIPAPVEGVQSIRLDNTALEFTGKGQTATLKATVLPETAVNKALTWESYDTAIATVDANGKVTAVGNGMTTIVVTSEDNNYAVAYCRVTVNMAPATVAVSSVSLNKTSATLTSKGATTTLTATVSPSNSTNKAVTWNTDNSAVATVSNGVVTAVANGSCNITVKTADDSKTATCKVTVSIPVPVSSISVTPSSVTLTKAGETTQLSATVSPSNADNKSVTWSTDNSAVATVNSSGVVTAVANGSCNITARTADGGKTSSCKVTVNIATTPSNTTSISLAGGKTKILSFGYDDVPTGVDIRNITYEFKGNVDSIDTSNGWAFDNDVQRMQCGIRAVKAGNVQVIGKYGSTVLKIWNITVTSNWDVYIAYENWKRGVEAKIWNSSMNTVQKLDALENYIKTEFKYSMDSSGASNRLYAYQYMMCDCFGASGMFGDMAKDIDPNLQVGYVDYPTRKIYTYMADAVANSYGHMCNAVYINGQWIGYDASPIP